MDASGALFKAACYFDLAVSHKAGPHGNLLHHRDLRGAMAHLHRLILLVVVALCTQGAHALVPTVQGYSASAATSNGGNPVKSDTKAGVCAALQATSSVGWTFTLSGSRCNVAGPQGEFYGNVDIYGPAQVCPTNSTAVTGGCQCTAPYVENAAKTACDAPPDPCLGIKGAMYGEIEWASASKGNNYACLGGAGQLASCQTVAVCDYTSQVPGQSGYTCRGIAYATGGRASMCTGNGESGDGPSPAPVKDPLNPDKLPSPGQPAPARCPAGQAPGEFNGARICAPTGGGTQTSTPAPGNGSTTVNNSDGSSTTSTQTGRTTCQQGQCTTTTNITNITTNAPGNDTCPSGQTPGTKAVNGQTRTTCTGTKEGSTTEAQSGFCEKNSKDKQCDGDGADTSFGGTCASGFKAVSDDAVLNAMAEEQHKRNCEMLRTDGEPSTWVTAEGQKTDNVMANSPHNAEFTIGAGSFDTSDALGGGGCSLNKTVTVRGYSVALPFNVLCDPLAVFGQILVAVAFLLAARIVTRG